ncbi:MAG: OmpA family protein [Paludibacteraceae bacterium]|nr:OmpA family protein [Paludibacteraceae bacterium]
MQSCSLNARLKKADKEFNMGEYFSAGEKYRKLFSQIPAKDRDTRAKVLFHQAECYRLLNYHNAEQMYANAIRFGYPDSLVYLRYAQSLHRNAKYDLAAKNYAIYLQKDSTHSMAANGLKALELSAQFKATPTPYLVRKADAFNARRSYSFSPAFSGPDGDMLFFTSNRSLNAKTAARNSRITGMPVNKIYSSKKNAAGKWEKPQMTSTEEAAKTVTDDGTVSFTADGRMMFITRARQQTNGEAAAEIYVSSRAGGSWSEPKKLEVFKDSTISVAHPAIAPDDMTLYFVSDAPNGFGGKDIWIATYDEGTVKDVRNAGPQINTPGDEMFPTVRRDATLYFSSNGLPGIGGLDIFKAVQNDKDWIVENMAMPINSNFDDFGIAFEGNAERGFFSSNRGQNRGYDLIWSFELPEYEYLLEGRVLDENQNPVPDAYVRLVSNSGINARVQVKKDGTYRIKIDKDIDCVMMAGARGFLNKEARLSTEGVKESKIFTQDFSLVTIFKPIQMDNIFYEFGKWNLTPESETGLQELVKILRDNPNITIEISAHTDHVGNNEANKTLSERRAQSVVEYLIAAGIAKDRLSAVGYGEEKPFVVNAATVQRFSFLKENDELTEAFVNALSADQQEQAKQINRRTEFRVLKTTYK